LVTKDQDEYKKILAGAKKLAADGVVVRGLPVTEELYDLILFAVHSFVRPIMTELYALKHNDVSIQERTEKDGTKRKWLLLTVRNGKTGMRMAHTLEGAVAPLTRLCERYPDATDEDYLFLPHYQNRATAARIFARNFNKLMEETGLKIDTILQTERTIYSLRRTAICMRLVLSEGKVNIYTLAKNVGTSVEQIERFYARNLPISAKLVKNLQSFGE
jgi:hypothetical protein